jgi:hypothetical protein
MSGIEPNLHAAAGFVALWSLCCLGFFQLAGLYPLRRDVIGPRASRPLVLLATVLWIALLAATVRFAVVELRWTSIVVIGGLLFLFLPEAFQAVPGRYRDATPGVLVAAGAFAVALLLLVPNLSDGWISLT